MSFVVSFAGQTALAMAMAYAWFVVPGLLVQRLLPSGVAGRSPWLFAPLLGLATFGPFSSLCFSLLPYDLPRLLACYALLNLGLWYGARGVRADGPPSGHGTDAARQTLWLVQGVACVLALVPCVSIFPFVYNGGLYTGNAIHDHARVVFIDAIYRHGLPPLNPLFAPGQDVPLNYYYLWLWLASQLRMLGGVAGWPADVALTWFSCAAALLGCAGVARELGKTRIAAWATLALLMSGPAWQALPWARDWVPPGVLATAIAHATWAPHHLLAAAAIVLALWLYSRASESNAPGWRSAFVLGGLLACVFGCSVWLAFALLVSAPCLLLAVFWQRRAASRAVRSELLLLARACAVAAPPCVFVLVAATSGPFTFHGVPVALAIQQVVSWTDSAWLQLPLYWLYAIPVAYGAACFLGVYGLARGLRRVAVPSLFVLLSAVATVSFLLVSQLIASTVVNNDLGWRAHSVAYLLLAIWGGVGLEELVTVGDALQQNVAFGKRLVGVLGLSLVLLGLYAAPHRVPAPAAHESPRVRAEHQRWLAHARGWQIVRRYSGPDDFVQSNPFAFADLCPWPVNLSFTLLSDRRARLSHPNWIYTYSHGMDKDMMRGLDAIVTNAFAKEPQLWLLRSLRDQLHVKVLLVDREDAVWNGDALERSGLYRRVDAEDAFRVYVATPH